MTCGRDMALGAACSDLGCLGIGVALSGFVGAVVGFAGYGLLHYFGILV